VTDSAVGEMFDSLAGTYDADPSHPLVSDALVDGLEYGLALVADVACGTGIAAFAAAGRRNAGRVLAIDVSAGMIARAKAKAASLDRDGRIEFSVGEAVPLPVSPGTVDAVVCASALHFIGAAGLRDWVRVLRPGGRVAFSVPDAELFSPAPEVAAVLPNDFALPATETDAAAIAADAGFTAVAARRVSLAGERPRSVFVVHAELPS
jgi:arsenite methyltransferase